MASNDDGGPFHGCICRQHCEEMKKDIDELKLYLVMAIEQRPELVKKISELVFFKIDKEIIQPLEQIGRDCDEQGYQSVLQENEIGCEAHNHHCVC